MLKVERNKSDAQVQRETRSVAGLRTGVIHASWSGGLCPVGPARSNGTDVSFMQGSPNMAGVFPGQGKFKLPTEEPLGMVLRRISSRCQQTVSTVHQIAYGYWAHWKLFAVDLNADVSAGLNAVIAAGGTVVAEGSFGGSADLRRSVEAGKALYCMSYTSEKLDGGLATDYYLQTGNVEVDLELVIPKDWDPDF